MNRDYYNILGIERSASPEDIKKAYRKMAMEWHPDRHKGDKDAEEKFKGINEAYEILKDPEKKQNYDRFGDPAGTRRFTSTGAGFNHPFGPGFTDFDDIFSQAFGFSRKPVKNQDYNTQVKISLEDAFKGKVLNFEARQPHNSELKKINITLPPGTKNGLVLRLVGQGSTQNPNLQPGDLMVKVLIEPHPVFTPSGDDLHMAKKMSVIDAALGKEIEIDVIEGGKIRIDIPAGTQPNHQIRVRGKGMPWLNNASQRGDLYIHLDLEVPINLTEQQRKILSDFQKEAV